MTRAHLGLNLVRMVKDNKKGFLKYIDSKRKTRENVGLTLNEVAALAMEDTGKAELLNDFLASDLTAKTGPQESQTLKVKERVMGKEDFPTVEEGLVRDHLRKRNIYKSMGPSRIQP